MPRTNRPPKYRCHKARNCAVVTIAPRTTLENPMFTTSYWGVDGLMQRDD